jgi:hypothetical protein
MQSSSAVAAGKRFTIARGDVCSERSIAMLPRGQEVCAKLS